MRWGVVRGWLAGEVSALTCGGGRLIDGVLCDVG